MPHPALLLAAALLGASAPAPTLAAMPALTAALPMQADTLPPQVRDPRALRREIDRRYPRELFAEGVTGTVVLRVGVSPQGRTTEVAVDRSSGHPRLDEAAAAAVRAASFIPGSHRGQTVAATLRIPVTLRPPAPGEQAAPRERIDDHASARPDPEAAGWDERDERVERHRLASGAFERAQAAYQEALEALQEIGERWTPLRAALAEAEGALQAAREADDPADPEILHALEQVVEQHRDEIERLEPTVTQRRARVQLALEDVRERAAALREAEAGLRGGHPDEAP
jgi:TonB family protein